MPSPVWKGSEVPELQPGYPRFRRDARGATLTLVFRGPIEDLRTYGPDIGDDVTLGAFDYAPSDEIIYADSVECVEDAGGAGTLTIVYSNAPNSGGSALIANQTTIEVDYTPIERPLITHKRYVTGGTNALTDDDRRKIEVWRNEPSTANYNANSTNGKHFIDKLKKGIESYIIASPVARRTTRGTSAPAVNSVGTRSATAPVTGAPTGYEWLKTGDRALRQAPASGWERVEEWTGAREVDADLYDGVI